MLALAYHKTIAGAKLKSYFNGPVTSGRTEQRASPDYVNTVKQRTQSGYILDKTDF